MSFKLQSPPHSVVTQPMLENSNRSSRAVVTVAADVRRPYRNERILWMYVGVHACFTLTTGGENETHISSIIDAQDYKNR